MGLIEAFRTGHVEQLDDDEAALFNAWLTDFKMGSITPASTADVVDANPNHHPAGAAGGKGGQFAPKRSGGGIDFDGNLFSDDWEDHGSSPVADANATKDAKPYQAGT